MLLILWALGWSMITLAALVHLAPPVVAAVGLAMIALHNLFDGVNASALGRLSWLWSLLHAPSVVLSMSGHIVFAAYPLVPWLGVTAAGYGFGQVFDWSPERRQRLLLRLGIGLIAAFVLLRLANIYGDPIPWTTQRSAVGTLLSFLNSNKYPPSLLYVLMTLGPAMLCLRAIDARASGLLDPARLLGRVPLFYFLLHLPLIHLLAVAICEVRYGDAHWMFESASLDQFPFTRPPGWGYALPTVYLVWAAVVIILYPACRWFGRLKHRHRDLWWLGYL